MSYCSVNEIKTIVPEDELINLTVDNPDEDSTVDVAMFEDISKYADELINGYLRSRYTLPLSLVPDLIKKLASDIVAYRLYLRRPQDIPEHIKENYKMAVRTLSEIQKGTFILDMPQEHPDQEVQKPKPSFLTNKNSNSRYFNDSYFNKFRGERC